MRKITALSLVDGLRNMAVGETRIVSDDVTVNVLRVTATRLQDEGFIFITSTKSGPLTITRLK